MSQDTATQILTTIIKRRPKTKAEFDRARTDICGEMKITQPPNRALILAYQTLLKKNKIKRNKLIEDLLIKAGVRTQSGIAVVTSLVKPYACPGKCVYCPTEIRMPKSYIATEPAAARASLLNFDPYEQMRQRILMLEGNGHPTDKIEFIVKGGTWNAYPLKYQYWFILESFRACNNMRTAKGAKTRKYENQPFRNFASFRSSHVSLEDLQSALEIEQKKNERAKHRIIGITLETRPDAITPKTIYHMRQMGCTRIELGLQAPDDAILKLIKRGHTVQQFRDAMFLLRQAGFKVDLHFMPDLPGTTPEHDVEMYKSLFSDPGLMPDMVKIYPNTVIKSAALYQWFLDGRYTPYGEKELFEALLQMKLATPRYCRISRLIRDIPETEIEGGNRITNLREVLEKELHKRGQKCVCLRCREISRHLTTLPPDHLTTAPKLFVDTYETIGGTEYFISFEDKDRTTVYGFLRLRLPTNQPPHLALSASVPLLSKAGKFTALKSAFIVPSLERRGTSSRRVATSRNGEGVVDANCVFIRELHVYGQLVGIGKQNADASQHKGLGKKLMQAAEKIARQNGYKKIAVISGVGVRGYYRKLGYRKVGTYMAKTL